MALPTWALGTIAALLLATSVGLALPSSAPGYETTRDILVHAAGLAGAVAALPCFWRLGGRFRKHPKLARTVGLLLWLCLVCLVEGIGLLANLRFMSQREVSCTVRSHDGRVIYDVYRNMNWNDPGDPEITMRIGIFETVLVKGHHEDPEDLILRGIDIVAHGHRLVIRRGGLAELYANSQGGVVAFIDGQEAFVDWR